LQLKNGAAGVGKEGDVEIVGILDMEDGRT
jgi:hypothetical protein